MASIILRVGNTTGRAGSGVQSTDDLGSLSELAPRSSSSCLGIQLNSCPRRARRAGVQGKKAGCCRLILQRRHKPSPSQHECRLPHCNCWIYKSGLMLTASSPHSCEVPLIKATDDWCSRNSSESSGFLLGCPHGVLPSSTLGLRCLWMFLYGNLVVPSLSPSTFYTTPRALCTQVIRRLPFCVSLSPM